MSKSSEMSTTIEELRTAAAAINAAVSWLTERFGGIEEAKEPEKPTVTLAQVRAALADKSRAGHTAEVRALLQQFGASRLSEVDPQHYAALLQEAEVL